MNLHFPLPLLGEGQGGVLKFKSVTCTPHRLAELPYKRSHEVLIAKNCPLCYTVAMNTIAQLLPYIQLFLALLLIIIIVLQRSGDGIEGALGGTASTMSRSARRGGEKVMFYATIIIAILFIASAIVGILLSV